MINLIKRAIVEQLKKRGYHLHASGYLKGNFFELMLYELLKQNNELFFIQIGANDGVSFDPIHKFVTANHRQVAGIVIEPLDDYFKQLGSNYRNYPNITPLNAAVHNSSKEMLIYRVDPDRLSDYPGWASGISSFNKQKLIESDKIDPAVIISEKVPCISLEQLIQDHHIEAVDLLQIDTEGYDFEIVSAINFSRIKPKIIQFEHGVSKGIMSLQKLDELKSLLHQNNYELWLNDWDAVAFRSDIFVDL